MKMRSNESGSIVLEAAMILPFVLALFFLFIYLINLFIVESYIQYGLNQAANEIGGYTYYMEFIGINDYLRKLNKESKANNTKINEEIQTFTDAYDSLSKTYNSLSSLWNDSSQFVDSIQDTNNLSELQDLVEGGKEIVDEGRETLNTAKDSADKVKTAYGKLKQYASDPMYVVNMLIGQLKAEGNEFLHQWGGQLLGKLAMSKYVNDKYLEAVGVVSTDYNGMMSKDMYNTGVCGMNFKGSSFLADSDCRVVDIVVTYRIKFPCNFAKLAPENTALHDNSFLIVQRAVCYGWVNGDGTAKDKYNE